MQQRNIGYVLMGPVGTGKSFFAGCIANALMEQGIAVMMTNFSRILNELTKPYADKNEFISHLVSYPLLIIDDLGIERNSEFALEMIYNIIDRRYCIKKPLIVTTNLSYRYDESRSGYGSSENIQQADGNVSSDYLSRTGSASA